MVLWDGSPHGWLEGRGPPLCLMGTVEDATGELLPGAHFVLEECTAGYLRLLRDLVRARGIPLSVYQDRHSALHRNDGHLTLAEQLRGEPEPTRVGRALAALEIEPIFALTPQAKGRVERRWGYLQDRLTTELRLAGASTPEQANAVLERRRDRIDLAVRPPRDSRPAWRPLAPHLDLDRICSFFYEATVQNDSTVRVDGHVLDIPPGPGRRGYPKARVEVRQLLDGSFRVYHPRYGLIATAPAPPGPLRALRRRRRSARVSRGLGEAVRALAARL
jgi:hypothetical protein